MYQIELDAPFHQLISMSGTPLMMKPLPPVVADNIYQTVISVLGLRDLPVADRIAALSSTSSSEILSKLPPGLPFLAVLDGITLQEEVSFEKLRDSSKFSQKQLLIGSCGMDVCILESSCYFQHILTSQRLAFSGSCSLRRKRVASNASPRLSLIHI